jgi:hypothetical protein
MRREPRHPHAPSDSAAEPSTTEAIAAMLRRAEASEHAMRDVLDEVARGTPALARELLEWLLRERRHLAVEETVRTLRAQVALQRALIDRLEELSDEAQEAVASCATYEERVAELEVEHEELRGRIARVVDEDGVEDDLPLRDGVERVIEELLALRARAVGSRNRRIQ